MSTPDQIVARKERMALYARAHCLALAPGFNPQVGIFGGAAVRTLKVIQTYLDLPASGKWGPALQAALFPATPQIRHDYHALRSSGTRPLGAVRLFVLHDMEDTALDQAAEDTGRFFESRAAQGSAHFGIDDAHVQQYLDLDVIPWGAPHANTQGVHIEQMGAASWTAAQWLTRARGTLDRAGWLLSHLHRQFPRVPLEILGDAQLRAGVAGITTHRQVTRVFGPAGGHTDPGPHYPLAYVVGQARFVASL
jgi:hypothetical protein